jgi:hypothetical protein
MIKYRTNPRKTFFAPKPLIAAVGKAKALVLQGMAAYVMRDAKQSIHKSKKPAAAGQPPHSHTNLLKRLIRFAFDFGSRVMLVGPEKAPAAGWDEPEALEQGGVSLLRKPRYEHGRKIQKITVAPHPFMGPALKKNTPKFPALWTNSIKP